MFACRPLEGWSFVHFVDVSNSAMLQCRRIAGLALPQRLDGEEGGHLDRPWEVGPYAAELLRHAHHTLATVAVPHKHLPSVSSQPRPEVWVHVSFAKNGCDRYVDVRD